MTKDEEIQFDASTA